MKKFALVLGLLVSLSAVAFAADPINLDGKLDKSKVISSKVEGNSLLAEYPNKITLQVDKKNNKIQSVRYLKNGFQYEAVKIGDEWNFHRVTGHSDFSYNRGGMTYHYFTEKNGTATVYETKDSRIIAITRIAKSYADTAKKYHNQRQLGLIK